jgi:stage II sporulation protein AA (anti-sigma F factor antagonist)
MEIQEQSQGAVAVLKLAGPLVEADADQFKTRAVELIKKNLGRVLIDASALAFVDSRGIEVLADITDELSQSGRALKLCGANPTVRQVLELTGWSDAFEYFDDVNAGVRSFL